MATKYITLTNLGTFLDQLKSSYSATETNYGGIKLGYKETGRNYPVKLGTNEYNKGQAYVNVPWEPGELKLATASSDVLGGIKIGYNNGSASVGTNSYKAPLLLGTVNPNIGKAYVDLSVANTNNAGLLSAELYNKLYNLEQYVLPTATDSKLGGVKIGSNITVGADGTISLSKENVIGALKYTPADEKNTSSGGGMVELKWEKLSDMREKGQLSPGTKYRIIDYTTVVNSTDAVSIENSFDIIVEAISTNELSENAKACLRDGDEYFQNSNLSAWELKYCIKNDTYRFGWAAAAGKGVIYYMKDEWGNEAPYDFKCIKVDSSAGTGYRFTFTGSNGNTNSTDHSLTGTVKNNVIKPWRSNIAGQSCYYINRILLSGETIEDNYFGYNCSDIDINGQSLVLANKFDDSCDSIFIYGYTIVHNTFGNDCAHIDLNNPHPSNPTNNVIIPSINVSKTGEISYNTFGNNCKYITANKNFRGNTFGNNCNNFVVNHDFMKNVIGNNCSKWLFGHHCMKNTIIPNNCFAYLKPDNDDDPIVPDYNVNNSDDIRKYAYSSSSEFAGICYCYSTSTTTINPLCSVCNCVFDQNSHIKIKLENDFNQNIIDPNHQDFVGVLRNYIFINLKNEFFDNADNNIDAVKKETLYWTSSDKGGVAAGTGTKHCPDLNEPEITYVSLNSNGKIIKMKSSKLFDYFP